MSTLFCSRPLAKDIDFDNSKFVVGVASGLLVNGKRLKRGEVVPQGVLSAYALSCEYDRPLRRIELLDVALLDPDLRIACLEMGTIIEDTQVGAFRVEDNKSEIDFLSRKDLEKLCKKHNINVPRNISKEQLRESLRSVVG